MTLFELIPVCDDPMSRTTLLIIVGYTIATGIVLKVGWHKMCRQEDDNIDNLKSLNDMRNAITGMQVAVEHIETGVSNTHKDIAEINRILFDKLT